MYRRSSTTRVEEIWYSAKMNRSMMMGGSGGASGLASIMDKLPSFRKVIGWFKGNDMNIDNHLFRMHYLVSNDGQMLGN